MSKLAFATVAFIAISAPAFAGDQDLATLQADSGRIIETAPAAQTPSKAQSRLQAIDAYAFAGSVQTRRNARVNTATPFQGSNQATEYVTSY